MAVLASIQSRVPGRAFSSRIRFEASSGAAARLPILSGKPVSVSAVVAVTCFKTSRRVCPAGFRLRLSMPPS